MHPPSWICESLYRIHPLLRLAWHGREKRHENELNPGCFALIQLYHVSDVAEFEDPTTFRLPWVADPVEGSDGATRLKRVNRGPIFNKEGGTRMDWDSAFRVPIFVATLDGAYDISTNDVLTGRFLDDVRRWMVPIKRRVSESAIEAGRRLESKAENVAGQMTDFLAYEANKPDAATAVMANKHAKGDMDKLEKRLEKAHGQLADYYSPPEV